MPSKLGLIEHVPRRNQPEIWCEVIYRNQLWPSWWQIVIFKFGVSKDWLSSQNHKALGSSLDREQNTGLIVGRKEVYDWYLCIESHQTHTKLCFPPIQLRFRFFSKTGAIEKTSYRNNAQEQQHWIANEVREKPPFHFRPKRKSHLTDLGHMSSRLPGIVIFFAIKGIRHDATSSATSYQSSRSWLAWLPASSGRGKRWAILMCRCLKSIR